MMHEIDNDVRMSDSPGRSPQVTTELGSPVRSVQPDLMGSIHSQADFGHRTADFFDHKSSSDSLPVEFRDRPTLRGDDMPQTTDAHQRRSRSYSTAKQRRSGHYLGGTTEQFHSYCVPERREPTPPSARSPTDFEKFLRLTPGPPPGGFQDHYESDNSFSIGSVEEMTPSNPVRRSYNNNKTNKNNIHLETPYMNPRSSPPTAEEESPILPKHNMADHIKEVHQITMQTLLESGSQGAAPDLSPHLHSDPRPTSKYLDHQRNFRYRSSSAPIRKKVTMAPPPPIDTTAASRNWPNQKAVKTPYPFHQIARNRKDFGRQFSASEPVLRSPRSNDSILNLTIRRSNPNSHLRLTTLTIPANSESSSDTNNTKRQHSSSTQDFDDAELFHQLRRHYAEMLGPYRFFSARSLSKITVNGTASRTADSGYGWLVSPRSPRVLAYKGLNDTFSEANLLRFFQDPRAAGRRRYAWVSWAHRLADAPGGVSCTPLPFSSTETPPTNQDEGDRDSGTAPVGPTPDNNRFSMIRKLEQHEGLEFVVSWSMKRILLALSAVVSLSIAAILLWIFLGASSHSPSGNQRAGYRNAGDRVVSGVVMGICVLLVGLTGFGGWIGVSLLVL